jgi:hypothetical protein
MAVKATWKGKTGKDGLVEEFHTGIPARDLTDDDWNTLSKDEQDTVKASKLYNVLGVADSTEEDREKHRTRLENRQSREAEKAGEEV